MKLPWFSGRARQHNGLIIAWDGQALAYVQARRAGPETFRIERFGVERQGGDSADAFARRLAGLGLKGLAAQAMLRPAQYQMLQIEAPAVPPDELRTAARWQIRDMVSQHVDDLTLDVLKVGDEQVRTPASLFVVAAANAEIRAVLQTAQALRCEVGVIDIHDLAQRNLQSAQARHMGLGDRAHAAVVILNDSQALLTICAHGELFYTRRIDLGVGFIQAAWGAGEGGANGVNWSDPSPTPPERDEELAQRLLVEVQRSLDLWERTWPMLALDHVAVQAGERTAELAGWLGPKLGHTVLPLDVAAFFPGFEGGSDADRLLCWPLLGVLMRSEDRKL